jgi:hypothetical protein
MRLTHTVAPFGVRPLPRYAEQEGTGVPLADLVSSGSLPARNVRSVVVRSRTGYRVRLPIGDLGGRPVSAPRRRPRPCRPATACRPR